MSAALFRVILPVFDIERAETFYHFLLQSPGRRVSSGRHYFDCGGTILACYDPHADGDDREAHPNPEPVYFAVEELDAFFARAQEAGCQDLDPQIATRPWGERSFYARDPFGNPICFVDRTTLFTGEYYFSL